MNRCSAFDSSVRLAWRSALAIFLSAWITLSASAQMQAPARTPPIPAAAVHGMLRVTASPEVLLDGRTDRLAPGARIHAHNNLLVLPAGLTHQDLAVRYVRDTMGLIREVWILTDAERPTRFYAPDAPNY